MRISAPDNTVYYGPKMDRIDTVYGRKCPVFTTFTVRFRIVNDAVLIDLGSDLCLKRKKNEFNNYNRKIEVAPLFIVVFVG